LGVFDAINFDLVNLGRAVESSFEFWVIVAVLGLGCPVSMFMSLYH